MQHNSVVLTSLLAATMQVVCAPYGLIEDAAIVVIDG